MSASSVLVKDLLSGIIESGSLGEISIQGLSLDSRKVEPGYSFLALQGTQQHGITFAPAALAHGAAIIIAEAPAPALYPACEPILWVDHLTHHISTIAARFFSQPSQLLEIIGVTGTNGKTSVVQLIAQALAQADFKVATIGTLGTNLNGILRTGERTTPDAITTQALLAEFTEANVTHVAMEVSSHALEQGRVNAVNFDIAIFTNLTHDHLDYHGTMEAYGTAKAKLFLSATLRCAIVNADDVFGHTLLSNIPNKVQIFSYGIDSADQCDVAATNIIASSDGLHFNLRSPWGEGIIKTNLLGRFNVANLLAVTACLGALKFNFAQIKNMLQNLAPVTGRMNRLGGEKELPLVVIDYAHTPDALRQALSSLREHTVGRLLCVFGCGGERDTGKRKQMAAIAEQLADLVIVTDDNPRSEDGNHIVSQIIAGFSEPQQVMIERDRAVAINRAVSLARTNDIVLIAGKGHETYQEIAGRKLPFDDLTIAKAALECRLC